MDPIHSQHYSKSYVFHPTQLILHNMDSIQKTVHLGLRQWLHLNGHIPGQPYRVRNVYHIMLLT